MGGGGTTLTIRSLLFDRSSTKDFVEHLCSFEVKAILLILRTLQIMIG